MTSKTKKRSKKVDKNKLLIKTISVFFIYFLYSYILNLLFDGSITASFIADLLFMFGIIFAYKNNLKEDAKNLKTKYNIGKIIKTILIWVVIIFVFNIGIGFVIDLISPLAGKTLDDNTTAIDSLFKISTIYTIFKTMIFGVVAEELLYRESINDVIKNKWLFIVVSSMIYTILNFIFLDTNPTNNYYLMHVMMYFLPALIFSTAYYKNNCNIIILMLIKFTYQLIPLTLMFISA